MRMRLFVRGLVVAAGLAITTLMGAAGASAAPADLPDAFFAEAIKRNSGKCVNVAGGSSSAGAWIQQYRCDNTPAAKFLFLKNSEGYYEIQNQTSHKCVDIEFGGTWNGARTQQFNCHGGWNQQFDLADQGNGYVKFISRNSGKCVDVPNSSHSDRVVLQIWNCVDGAANQDFRLNIS